MARGTHFSLVTIFAHGPSSSGGALKPGGPWDSILSSGARSTPFSQGPLLACGTHRALSTTLAREPNAAGWAQGTPLARGAIGPDRTRGAFVALQSRGSGVPRGAFGAREAPQSRLPLLTGGSRGSWLPLGPLSAFRAREPMFARRPRGAGVPPLTQGSRVPYLSLRTQDPCWSGWARLALKSQFSSLSGVPRYPLFSLGTRGALRPRESQGALQSREALFSGDSWGPVLAHVTLGAWLSCWPRLASFPARARWSSLSFLPLLARLAPLSLLS